MQIVKVGDYIKLNARENYNCFAHGFGAGCKSSVFKVEHVDMSVRQVDVQCYQCGMKSYKFNFDFVCSLSSKHYFDIWAELERRLYHNV